MRQQKAFTLIEVLVVMLIIMILSALIIPKITEVKEKALRTSCSLNVKSLTQALSLYSSDTEGYIRCFDHSDGALDIFGAIFQKDGWNDLSNLICPKNDGFNPPLPNGYGNPLVLAADGSTTYDYWVVFTGNSDNVNNELNTLSSPGTNVLVVEKFSGVSNRTLSDIHQGGGTIGRINGQAEFVESLPLNLKDDSDTLITKADCAT